MVDRVATAVAGGLGVVGDGGKLTAVSTRCCAGILPTTTIYTLAQESGVWTGTDLTLQMVAG